MPPKFPKFGTLNRINRPVMTPRAPNEPLDMVRKSTEFAFLPDAVKDLGPLKAVVLRVDSKVDAEPGTWVTEFFGSFVGEQDKGPSLVKIKARIPELHSMLPTPDSLGNQSYEQSVIDMYPTFVAQNEDVPEPAIGSVVWVDFTNKQNFEDPVYLGPVQNSVAVPAAVAAASAQSAHQDACGGKMLAEQPKGQSLTGKNKPLSHAGLPLLPRQTKKYASKEFKTITEARASNITVNKWVRAIEENGHPGASWIGVLNSNGLEDSKHPKGKRNTIIYVPNTTDFTLGYEIIYFFHGYGEFGSKHDFKNRIAPATKKLISQKRNFVLVIPELPWSIETETPRSRGGEAWKGRDNFSNFHREVLGELKNSFSFTANNEYVSIIGHSAGGGAIRNVVKDMASVGVKSITFSDGDYANWVKHTYDRYVSKNDNVLLNILVGKSGTPRKKAQEFINSVGINRPNIYLKQYNLGHRGVGDESIAFVNPNIKSSQESQAKQALADAKKTSPSPDTEEDAQSSRDPRSPPETKEQRQPMAQNAPTSPSAKVKQGTQAKLPSGVTLVESEKFKEIRVYVKDYGSLPKNSELLIPVTSAGSQRYLHVLTAKRFSAMSAAWQSETGGGPLKVASGWRQKRFSSKAEYEQFLIKKYSSRVGGDAQKAVKLGRKLIGFESPHQTGLAIDFGSHGLSPNSKTIPQQKQTRLYKWLVNNAHRFGFTNYKVEPWHWENAIPKESWLTGQEFTDNLAVFVQNSAGDLKNNIPTKVKEAVARVEPNQGRCVVKLKDVT